MPKVFISYSHIDQPWKERLLPHLNALQKAEIFDFWEDGQINAGEDWFPQIKAALEAADVAILLVSVDYLASDFVLNEEVAQLLHRRKNEGIRIIPVIVRACPWSAIDWLAGIQLWNKGGIALAKMEEHEIDESFANLALELSDHFKTQTVKPHPQDNFIIDRLPTVPGEFFGREAELELLDQALADVKTHR